MLKTIFVLPDGSELSSGTTHKSAIRHVTITECVNDSEELTVGSACANMIEADILTPGGGLTITAGDELAVYRQDDSGQRHKVGLFTAQKPTRPSANTMRVTAYDRMSRLDKDLSGWLKGLTDWPCPLYDFAVMVCREAGLTLANEVLPNGAYRIPKFTADSLTGRTLIRWIGQIAGCFARINADGALEFAWYAPRTGISIGPRYLAGTQAAVTYENEDLRLSAEDLQLQEGERTLTVTSPAIRATGADRQLQLTVEAEHVQHYYFQNGLSYEDYAVAPVEKVQLQQSCEDVGVIWPSDASGERNTCTVTGNCLLAAANAAALEPVAESLYKRLNPVRYTPCKVTVSASVHIFAGDIVDILDANGKLMTMYVMKKTQSGQRATLECTGSPTRQNTMAVNHRTLSSLTGKVLDLRMDVEGLKAENRENGRKLASVSLCVDGIQTQVSRQQMELASAAQLMTQVRQDAEQVSVEVKNLRENGVSRVETSTGYTFGAEGLRIRKSGEEMENRLDNTGMYVTRSGETILQANSAGVTAADVTVYNYLTAGGHARFEEYSGQRTACFFV